MRVGIRNRPWAGLDVGEYSVKLLALQPGVGGVKHFVSELPLRRATGSDAVIPADQMAHLLSETLQSAGLSPRSLKGVSLGVSGSDVIVKQISLPIMDDAEVAGALRFEARKHLPFDLTSMVIDYQLVGRYPSEKRLDVLLAAVPQAKLDRALAPLRLLGIDADIVDAAPLALTNALSRQIERESESRVLLDIGHAGSWFTLYQKGAPYFSRRLDFGGVSVTQAISSALRIPFAEAEEWKLEAGADDPSMRVTTDSREMQAVQEALGQLGEELRRTFAFYRTMAPLPDPLSIWISGSTARLPGLTAKLSSLLDIPTFTFNPLDSLGAEHRTMAPPGGPQFAQAFGLALRNA